MADLESLRFRGAQVAQPATCAGLRRCSPINGVKNQSKDACSRLRYGKAGQLLACEPIARPLEARDIRRMHSAEVKATEETSRHNLRAAQLAHT